MLGIRNNFLKILDNYLFKRFNITKINSIFFSSKCEVTSGVPQGSILGPLLFILYINDMHNAINCLGTIHYADDTSNQVKLDPCLYISQLNNVFKEIMLWLKKNFMFLNFSKTKIINFSRKKLCFNTFSFDGHCIEVVQSYKYLGYVIQNNLKYDIHIKNLQIKINKFIPIFYQIKHMLTEQSKVLLFNSFILNNLWCYMSKFNKNSNQ